MSIGRSPPEHAASPSDNAAAASVDLMITSCEALDILYSVLAGSHASV
jgi:hypothetical protein